MAERIKLALIYGGKNGEHEVSLVSAASVLQQLDASRYEIYPISIDKQGLMHLHQLEDLAASDTGLPLRTPGGQAITSLIKDGHFFLPIDVVLPILHGIQYEDGCLQGLLRLANVAYVGCDVLSSAIGMDKDIARRLACTDGLKSTAYLVLDQMMSDNTWEIHLNQAIENYGWPLFIKPCASGSSVGIHKVSDKISAMQAIKDAFRYDDQVLIEAYAPGREIEVAVLQNMQHREVMCSCPGEIQVKHPDGFYSYAAKYLESECSRYLIPAPLDAAWTQKIQDAAKAIFIKLKCKGLARVDFFFHEETQTLLFNEVNTMPGFTAISLYPSLWKASDLSFSQLLDTLIETAMLQHQIRQHLVTDFHV
jgi:D-alanine-D-alanine ligase